MNRIVLLALCLAAFSAAAQTMYKWVDEKGTTHFSEYPPPDGKATKMDVKPGVPESAAPRGADDWKQRDLESRQRRVQKDAQEADARRRDQAQRGQRCRHAREGLDTVKNSRRVFNLDSKGERVYMEDQDRPAEIEKWSREVQRNCD
jgi:hypothetical protein